MVLYKIKNEPSPQVVETLKNYSQLTQRLLATRGIETVEEAEKFLNPHYERDTHDPFLFKDMKKAVDRILEAIDKGEKIMIYSDFDADGIPGAVVFQEFFELIGYTNIEVYIPHRHDEGFGFHSDAVLKFAEDKIDLVVTVDCGIADNETVEKARELGVDVIITDHHESVGDVPNAYAVVDHKQKDCKYPEEILCGTGVIFKVVQALLSSRDFGVKEGQEKWLLDMVALATCADMVPLTGENRVLAHWGLFVMRKSKRPSVQALCCGLKIKQQFLTEDDIGFMIAPRINAASRMGESMEAFSFLSTKEAKEADTLFKSLEELNTQRKGLVGAMVKNIRKKIEARENHGEVIVAGSGDWLPSLLGLVANTLVEEYRCPVFLWGKDGRGVMKGSCRSDGSADVVALMERAQEHLIAFGGHTMAGGFSVSDTGVHTLEEALCGAYREISKEKQEHIVMIDAVLPLEKINEATYREIDRFAPFGMGNDKPLFEFSDVVVDSVRMFGKTKNHFEIVLTQNGANAKAIGFFMTEDSFKKKPVVGEKVNVIGHIEKSYFGWKPEVRLRLVDILPAH